MITLSLEQSERIAVAPGREAAGQAALGSSAQACLLLLPAEFPSYGRGVR